MEGQPRSTSWASRLQDGSAGDRLVIRVMSFNIRYRQGDAGRHRWDRRRALVVARIRAFDPDLLGLQECNDDTQAKYVQRQLPEWDFAGERSHDPDCPIEMTPVLHKRDTFDAVDGGRFWLSDTPLVPGSRSWGSAFARVATWRRLVHRESGRPLVFLNVHVDYEPQTLEPTARVLRAWIDRVLERDPIIVTGDFNADERSSLYRDLACGGSLFDVFRRVHPTGPAGTYHGYGEAVEQPAIDWVLASDHFAAVDAEIDRFADGDRYPSDHYPLTAVLEWAGSV
jgi:endonuclease/exonuclease/phosphatase family metal-dependent hydrolase